MTYKDKSFCASAEKCENRRQCGRWLTEHEKKKIPRDMPVAWIPRCKYFKEEKK